MVKWINIFISSFWCNCFSCLEGYILYIYVLLFWIWMCGMCIMYLFLHWII